MGIVAAWGSLLSFQRCFGQMSRNSTGTPDQWHQWPATACHQITDTGGFPKLGSRCRSSCHRTGRSFSKPTWKRTKCPLTTTVVLKGATPKDSQNVKFRVSLGDRMDGPSSGGSLILRTLLHTSFPRPGDPSPKRLLNREYNIWALNGDPQCLALSMQFFCADRLWIAAP